MSNQIVISSGAKVRELEGVLTGTAGVVNALGINVPSGIPQLDGSGKILVSQLPNSVMEYKGTWNAATNTPTLANGTGNQGDVYLVSVAGTVNFGAGPITFAIGDQVIYSGTIWQKAGGSTGTVTSVSVTESGDALSITGSPITTSGTINIGFNGTSGQYVNGAGGLTTFPSLTGFVPYIGATSDVDLGSFDLKTAKLWLLDEVEVGYGSIHLADNSMHFEDAHGHTMFLVEDGFIQIHKDPTIQSNIFVSDLTATRNHYLPNASGTLALTSQLSAYLPLAGGTLTGGLYGTSALFTSLSVLNGGVGLIQTDFAQVNNQISLITRTVGGPSYSTGVANIGSVTAGLYITRGLNGGGILAFNSSATYTYTYPSATGTLALTSDLGAYLPLSGGTLSGQLSILRGSGTGLDVASDLVIFRAITGFGSPRQITLSAGNGATTYLEAKGYGGNYITDFGIRTYNSSGTAFEVFFATSAGNVGIGNTAPAAKLDVNGTGRFSNDVGVGVLPSGWAGSDVFALDVSLTGSLSAGSSDVSVVNNAYYNGSSWIYKQNGFASYFQQLSGVHRWFTAANGTAGGSVGFSEVMRISSAGNVGIGTSSPEGVLTIKGTSAQPPTSGTTANSLLQLVGSLGAELNIGSNTVAGGYGSYIQASDNNLAVSYPLNLQPNGGNVGIGTSNPSNKLDVRNGGDFDVKFRSDAAGGTVGLLLETANTFSGTSQAFIKVVGNAGNGQSQLLFGTSTASGDASASEKMRITSGGSILINRSSAASSEEILGLKGKVDSTVMDLQVGTDTYYGIRFRNQSGGQAGYIQVNSTLVIYGTGSDYRLKNDLRDYNGLELISKIKTYDFAWDVDNSRNYGVIAHELEQVIPYAVGGKKDAINKDGSINPQGVDYSKLVPILVKAIQEQQSQIESQDAKIEELKALIAAK